MKRITAIAAMLVIAMPAFASDEEEITKMLMQAESAWNSGNMDAWLSLLADDAIEMPPDEAPLVGIAAITERDTRFAADFDDVFAMKIESMRISGDLAVVRYSYEEAWTPKEGGDTSSAEGQTIIVLERRDGSWKFTDIIWAHVLAD
jgi:uncharacterized protein (TIGR02246 family)